MNFWSNVQDAAGLAGQFHWVILGFVLVAIALFLLVPAERTRIRSSFLIFFVGVAGVLIAASLRSSGLPETNTLYRALLFASLLIETVAVINVASVFVFDVALNAIRLTVPRIMRDLIAAAAYIVVTLSLLSQSGVQLTGIIATSAVLTAVIAFSLQDSLANVMGGIALQLEQKIAIGDWIRVDQHEGQVTEIRWRQTSIQTRNWDTIVIPNTQLIKNAVLVLGRRENEPLQERRWVYFNVDFRYPPAEVIEAVETALRLEPIANVAASPAPHCLMTEFRESYAVYAARYWLTDLALTDPTDSVVRSRVYYALRRAGIPLSIPAHSIFLTEEGEARRERKQEEEINRRVAALRHVELFHSLTEDELRELAPQLSVAPFTANEAITRQGAEAHWLYIVTKGVAEVRVSTGKLSEKVAELRAGDFFGEMGLMTGEPRTATVIAKTNVECYRLDKDAYHEVLRGRPEIAEDVSHILATRRVELEAVRTELSEEAKRQMVEKAQGDLLKRIRRFFTL